MLVCVHVNAKAMGSNVSVCMSMQRPWVQMLVCVHVNAKAMGSNVSVCACQCKGHGFKC